MAYTDSLYQTTNQELGAVGNVSAPIKLGTGTASATQTWTGTANKIVNGSLPFGQFIRPTKVNAIRIYCTTAPTASNTVTFFFLNGTTTFGSSVAISTAGVYDATITGPVVDSHGVISTNNSVFTSSGGQILMNTVSVSTASGDVLGTFAFDLDSQSYFGS